MYELDNFKTITVTCNSYKRVHGYQIVTSQGQFKLKNTITHNTRKSVQ
jgi:hypothetical protein